MKKRSIKSADKSENFDRFLTDMAEVLDVPKRRLNKIVFQFQDHAETKRTATNASSKRERFLRRTVAA
jgi:ABC-type Fe2+-enterobactin transport system substrate-binding protein